MAAKRNAAIELFWKIHPSLYKWTGGLFGGTVMGMPVLLLTTKGRNSGLPRERALMYLPYGDAMVVAASVLGGPKHPDWWVNLKATPEADVQVGRKHTRVRAREADGEERKKLWEELVTLQGDYAEYQTRTDRKIPVVVLDPL